MYARIIDMGGVQTVAEIIDAETYAKIPAPLNAEFVPQEPGMVYMATLENGVWTAPPDPAPAPDPEPTPDPEPEPITHVSPVEFKMLFTSTERIAIRQARATTSTQVTAQTIKAVLDDWFDIVDDPRLSSVDLTLQSTIDGVNFLVTHSIITAERAAQILAGEIQ